MSLGGLALGVGMLVDNSIVVLEAIDRRRREGLARRRGGRAGAGEVAGAVTAATLTTVSVFLPIVFVQGVAGQLFYDLAVTVCLSLLASLVVSLTLIPALSALRARTGFESAAREASRWRRPSTSERRPVDLPPRRASAPRRSATDARWPSTRRATVLALPAALPAAAGRGPGLVGAVCGGLVLLGRSHRCSASHRLATALLDRLGRAYPGSLTPALRCRWVVLPWPSASSPRRVAGRSRCSAPTWCPTCPRASSPSGCACPRAPRSRPPPRSWSGSRSAGRTTRLRARLLRRRQPALDRLRAGRRSARTWRRSTSCCRTAPTPRTRPAAVDRVRAGPRAVSQRRGRAGPTLGADRAPAGGRAPLLRRPGRAGPRGRDGRGGDARACPRSRTWPPPPSRETRRSRSSSTASAPRPSGVSAEDVGARRCGTRSAARSSASSARGRSASTSVCAPRSAGATGPPRSQALRFRPARRHDGAGLGRRRREVGRGPAAIHRIGGARVAEVTAKATARPTWAARWTAVKRGGRRPGPARRRRRRAGRAGRGAEGLLRQPAAGPGPGDLHGLRRDGVQFESLRLSRS